ncbi:unnamed protein product [Amoebophrya sp. A25]|nr:unnamed protein product [Amoebophrya sp. A25]|eukprot:GSA25T00018342001.1
MSHHTAVSSAAAATSAILVRAMACADSSCHFHATTLRRRPVQKDDVRFKILFCGVCHSDLHAAANHTPLLGGTGYPCVPGHELVGVVTEVGTSVQNFKAGDRVGVGTMVDSCRDCDKCADGRENECVRRVGTYNSPAKGWEEGRHVFQDGTSMSSPLSTSGATTCEPGTSSSQHLISQPRSIGGYSTEMVVQENCCIAIPDAIPLEYAGPILCAGITMYEPLKKHLLKPLGLCEEGSGGGGESASLGASGRSGFLAERLSGTPSSSPASLKVGIVGIGGLGVMGVQLSSRGLGLETVAITRGLSKKQLAEENGAKGCIDSTDPSSLAEHEGSFDIILDTVSVDHDIVALRKLLKKSYDFGAGAEKKFTPKLVLLGACRQTFGAFVASTMLGVKDVCVSVTGSLGNTREVVQLCAAHDIRLPIELRPVSDLTQIYEALDGGNAAAKRYVLDVAGSLPLASADRASNIKDVETIEKAPKLTPLQPPGYFGVVKAALQIAGYWPFGMSAT